MAAKQRSIKMYFEQASQNKADSVNASVNTNRECIKKSTKRKFCGNGNKQSADLDGNYSMQSTCVRKKIKLDPGGTGDKVALECTAKLTVASEEKHVCARSDVAESTGTVSFIKQNKEVNRSTISIASAETMKENELETCAAPQLEVKTSCVRISDIDVHTLDRFEVLTTSTLAIRYPRNFYKKLLGNIRKKEMIAKVAWWPGNCRAVGCICCRIEPMKRRLLIMTLSTIPTYRRRGVASELMRSVLDCTRAIPVNLKDAYLHVQTSNKAALAFYRSMGFVVSHEIKNYYRRLKPPDCFVLTKSMLH